MARSSWVVLMADIRASRGLPSATRARLPATVRSAIKRTQGFAPRAFRSGPELLKGDEIQAVLRPDAAVLTIVTHLRSSLHVLTDGEVELRVGLGLGAIDRLSSKGPFESDGQAFHHARAATEAVRRAGASRRTACVSGLDEMDALADVVLGLTDVISNRWTRAQWQAVRERVEGKELRRIAALESVSVQSVSKRLITASWSECSLAMRYLEGRMRSALGVESASDKTAPSTSRG